MSAQATSHPKSPPVLGRDEKGRFVRGNPGGPGNPFARKTAALRTALIRRMDEESIEKLADTLIEQAIEGDVPSARLVLQYVIGLPTQAIDPDDVDQLEWERERRQVVEPAELHAAAKGVPVAVASVTCSLTRACEAAKLADHLAERIDEMGQPEAKDDKDEEPDVLPMPAPGEPGRVSAGSDDVSGESASLQALTRPGSPAEGASPVNQPGRPARRCANPGRKPTPGRHPTAEPAEEHGRSPHPDAPERNRDDRPHFRRPDDPGTSGRA